MKESNLRTRKTPNTLKREKWKKGFYNERVKHINAVNMWLISITVKIQNSHKLNGTKFGQMILIVFFFYIEKGLPKRQVTVRGWLGTWETA